MLFRLLITILIIGVYTQKNNLMKKIISILTLLQVCFLGAYCFSKKKEASWRIPREITLENASLKRTWSIINGRLHTVAIINKLANKSSSFGAGDEFRFRVSDGPDVGVNTRTLTAANFIVTRTERTSVNGVESLIFHLENKEFKVEMNISLAKSDFYLRKRLTISALKPIMLERVDAESLILKGAVQPYTISQIFAKGNKKWRPGLGQPLYGENDATFWGLEFPAATNTVKDGKLNCGHLVGRMLSPKTPYTDYPSVLGVSDNPKFTQDAFFNYIDRIRIRPFRVQVQYNCWFDFFSGVKKESFAASVGSINDELVTKRGVKPLNAYVIDDGWQDTQVSWSDKVWKVNSKFDPDLKSSFKATTDAKSHLGLWLSPGMVFGAAKKVPTLSKEGYEVLLPWASLAGPKYMDSLESRMVELVAQGVTFFKLDGLFGHANTRVFELHGSRYGLPEMPQLGAGEFSPDDARLNDPKYDDLKTYYLVAGTERLMKNFKHLAKVNPEVYIVISNAAYLSPWWLQYADACWMINAGDNAAGTSRTDELINRDNLLYELSVLERTQFPLNAVFNHEPKKVSSEEAPEVFRNYLFMALSRGTGFLEFYLKPSVLKNADWNVLAEGMIWAEKTGPTFKRSKMHGGNPSNKEVYGFTGWLKDSGYVSIHNPSDKPQIYRFTLDRAFGLVYSSAPFVVSSPLAGSLSGLKSSYVFGDTIELTLAPYEVRILNFGRQALDWSRIRSLQKATFDEPVIPKQPDEK